MNGIMTWIEEGEDICMEEKKEEIDKKAPKEELVSEVVKRGDASQGEEKNRERTPIMPM
ncbi:MAG: hypothetical protein LUG54_05615 [Clostridiales bacterium]|nr:hypothetical protein [Clostridiales bacterium]